VAACVIGAGVALLRNAHGRVAPHPSCRTADHALTEASALKTFVAFARAAQREDQRCLDDLSSTRFTAERARRADALAPVLSALASRSDALGGAAYAFRPHEPPGAVAGISITCHVGSATFEATVVLEHRRLVLDDLDGDPGLIGR
jgi:hypothetical protein